MYELMDIVAFQGMVSIAEVKLEDLGFGFKAWQLDVNAVFDSSEKCGFYHFRVVGCPYEYHLVVIIMQVLPHFENDALHVVDGSRVVAGPY